MIEWLGIPQELVRLLKCALVEDEDVGRRLMVGSQMHSSLELVYDRVNAKCSSVQYCSSGYSEYC